MYFGLSTFALCSAVACLVWGIARLAGTTKHNWTDRDNVAGLFLLGLALLLHGIFVSGAASWSPRDFGSTESGIYEGMNENATRLLFLNGSQYVIRDYRSNRIPRVFWESGYMMIAEYTVWDHRVRSLEVQNALSWNRKGEAFVGLNWKAREPWAAWKYIELVLTACLWCLAATVWFAGRKAPISHGTYQEIFHRTRNR